MTISDVVLTFEREFFCDYALCIYIVNFCDLLKLKPDSGDGKEVIHYKIFLHSGLPDESEASNNNCRAIHKSVDGVTF